MSEFWRIQLRAHGYRFFADFFAVFFTAAFLLRVVIAAAALAGFFLPNANSQLSEYLFDAPIRTIVTAVGPLMK